MIRALLPHLAGDGGKPRASGDDPALVEDAPGLRV